MCKIVQQRSFILDKLFSRQDKPQEIDKAEKDLGEVEEIVNASRVKGVVQYRVWWTGCIALEDT